MYLVSRFLVLWCLLLFTAFGFFALRYFVLYPNYTNQTNFVTHIKVIDSYSINYLAAYWQKSSQTCEAFAYVTPWAEIVVAIDHQTIILYKHKPLE